MINILVLATALPLMFNMAVSKSEIFKVIILGDGGVGKSSLMNRYVSDKFDSQSFHTIGVEFLNKDVTINDEKHTIQIWDTAGQERFKSLRTPFYRGSDCCILTFCLDDKQSFINLSMWRKEFFYYADIPEQSWEHFPFILLGNKSDISAEERAVTEEEANQWCQDNGKVPYFETSAKTAVNVSTAFSAATERIIRFHSSHDDKGAQKQVGAINLNNKPSNKPASSTQSCCS